MWAASLYSRRPQVDETRLSIYSRRPQVDEARLRTQPPRRAKDETNHRGCCKFSTRFVWIFLAVLIAWGTVAGFVAFPVLLETRDGPILAQAACVILGALAMGMGGVVMTRKVIEIRIFIFTTAFLCILTIIIIVLDNGSAHKFFLIPLRTVALSLGLPQLYMCMNQPRWMHILIALPLAFVPILVANLAFGLPMAVRFALLLPPATMIAYKVAADLCESCSALNKTLIRTLIRGSGSAIIAGTSLAGAALALDLQQSSVWDAGFVLTMAGGLSLNISLVMRRWKNPTKNPSTEDWRSRGLEAITLLYCVDLFIIYSCLAHGRSVAIVPILALVGIYCALIQLHDPRRELTWTHNYVIIIIGSFAVTLFCAWRTIVFEDLSRNYFDSNHLNNLKIIEFPAAYPQPITFQTVREQYKNKCAAMWFATMHSSLVFIYFMMTVLVQTDPTAKRADPVPAQLAEERQELILSKAAEIIARQELILAQASELNATADRSEPCSSRVPAVPNACTIESPERLRAPRFPSSHVTLNIPD